MWRIFLSFVVHRIFLLAVIFASLYGAGPGSRTLWSGLQTRVLDAASTGHVTAAPKSIQAKLVKILSNPYSSIVSVSSSLTGLSRTVVLLVWSNIFFLLFVWELYGLLARFTTHALASSSAILLVLWPTSIEMSLGSGLGLTGFLVLGSLKYGLTSNWFLSGLLCAVVLAADHIAFALLPLLFFVFFHFERHFPIGEVARRAVYFFGPIAALGVFIYPDLAHTSFGNSALVTSYAAVTQRSIGWFISEGHAGQTVSLLIFLVGAASALILNTNLLTRLIPIALWVGVLISTPYAHLASRLTLAIPCLQGVATASSPQALRLVQALLVILGAYETWVVFAR